MTSMKEFIKSMPLLYRLVSPPARAYRQMRMLGYAVCRGSLLWGLRTSGFSGHIMQQAYLEYELDKGDQDINARRPPGGFSYQSCGGGPMPSPNDKGGILSYVKNHGLHMHEGFWTVYVPPQSGLSSAFPFMAGYPKDAGLKILKHDGHPNQARYFSEKTAASHPFCRGGAAEMIRVANYLHQSGIGPRLYDVAAVGLHGRQWTSYIVEHIGNEPLKADDYRTFMKRLRTVLSRQEISPVLQNWETSRDFLPPACNDNLLRDSETGELYYVDFQSFILRDEPKMLKKTLRQVKDSTHFGETSTFLGGRFPYQSVPGMRHGKRDTDSRWKDIKQLFDRHHIDLRGKLVFDMCCNSGMMLNRCLNHGAFWAVGWDLPAVIESAERLQSLLGMTRLDLIGKEIDQDTDFSSSVPAHLQNMKNGILFYLAASRHIGFPPRIGDLPWDTMVYEGHAGETIEETSAKFGNVPWLARSRIEEVNRNKREIGVSRLLLLISRRP